MRHKNFRKHFQTIQETKANVKGSRLQPGYYGEVPTREAAIERLKQREMQKSKPKSKSKQKVKKTVAKSPHIDQSKSTCQGCGAHYDKDTKEEQKKLDWLRQVLAVVPLPLCKLVNIPRP